MELYQSGRECLVCSVCLGRRRTLKARSISWTRPADGQCQGFAGHPQSYVGSSAFAVAMSDDRIPNDFLRYATSTIAEGTIGIEVSYKTECGVVMPSITMSSKRGAEMNLPPRVCKSPSLSSMCAMASMSDSCMTTVRFNGRITYHWREDPQPQGVCSGCAG